MWAPLGAHILLVLGSINGGTACGLELRWTALLMRPRIRSDFKILFCPCHMAPAAGVPLILIRHNRVHPFGEAKRRRSDSDRALGAHRTSVMPRRDMTGGRASPLLVATRRSTSPFGRTAVRMVSKLLIALVL